ncbi:MAG: divergent polysaccharide deacetylase family protein [Pseudomonadaceae bacterium]|nr:MAG: divergent polysaccharide deacetylase family protein [Pseudomonadaceae bacterium]
MSWGRLPALLALSLLVACSDPPAEPEVPPEPEASSGLPVEPTAWEQLVLIDKPEALPDWLVYPGTLPLLPEPDASDAALASAPPDGPVMAIVIDDLGHSYTEGRRIIALPGPVALAILPQTPFAEQLAREASQAGQTVMLHQPMENGAGLPIGPGGLYQQTQREDYATILRDNLAELPGVAGINNHMGSLLTADREAMDAVMAVLQRKQLFFLDSRTTAATEAAFAAAAAGVPHASRQVFLDHVRDAEAIARSFAVALEMAREEGQVIVIGHPYRETLAFLEQVLPGLAEREGVVLVPVTMLLER